MATNNLCTLYKPFYPLSYMYIHICCPLLQAGPAIFLTQQKRSQGGFIVEIRTYILLSRLKGISHEIRMGQIGIIGKDFR
jgi:hypothetical protein